jgi:hypothetical protein
VVARRCTEPVEVVKQMCARQAESERQAEILFESLLAESFA